MPVLSLGSSPADYAALAPQVVRLRKPAGLHLTLLHIGVLADFALDVSRWTKGVTGAGEAAARTAAWLRALPVLPAVTATAGQLITLGGGGVCALEVDVPEEVRVFQVSLLAGLRELLDGLLVDEVDDFILGSPALGYKYPHWTPHVAIGRPVARGRGPVEIAPLAVELGPSQIRNGGSLPP